MPRRITAEASQTDRKGSIVKHDIAALPLDEEFLVDVGTPIYDKVARKLGRHHRDMPAWAALSLIAIALLSVLLVIGVVR